MTQISVVIITFNEERNIERCILSVKNVADEIIVVDAFSTDKTEEICKKHNVNFVQRKFDGYSNQKNFANSLTSNPFILSLDADEELSNELIDSILKIKMNPKFDVFYFNRKSNYCGKWIKHGGWYPDSQFRLFDKSKVKWNKSIVHERIEYDKNTSVGFLKGDLLHYTIATNEEHLKVIDKYSTLKSIEMFEKGRKANFLKIIFATIFKFLKHYILKLGFLDGYFGFKIALNSAYSSYLKYAKLRKLNANE